MKETTSTYFGQIALPGTILLANIDLNNLLEAGLKSAVGMVMYLIGRMLYDRYQRKHQQANSEKAEQRKRTRYTIRRNKKDNK